LKKCILQEWADIESVITDAVESGDMTLDELETWPALELLRKQPEYHLAIAPFGTR